MPSPKLLEAILRALAGAGRGTRLPGALRGAPRLARTLPGRGGRALPGLGSAADVAPDIARVARGPVRTAVDVAPPGMPELRMAGEGLPPYPGRTPGRGLVEELSDAELAEAARKAWWRSEMAVERPAGDLSYAKGLRAVGAEESASRKLAEIQSEWMRRRGTGAGLEASLMGEGAPPRRLPSVSEFDQLDAAVLEGMDVSMAPGRGRKPYIVPDVEAAKAEGLTAVDLDRISEHARRYKAPARGAEKAIADTELALDKLSGGRMGEISGPGSGDLKSVLNTYRRIAFGEVVSVDDLNRALTKIERSAAKAELRLQKAYEPGQDLEIALNRLDTGLEGLGDAIRGDDKTSKVLALDRAVSTWHRDVATIGAIFDVADPGTAGKISRGVFDKLAGDTGGIAFLVEDGMPYTAALRRVREAAKTSEAQITLPPMQGRLLARAGKPSERFEVAIAGPGDPLPSTAIVLNDGTVIGSARGPRARPPHTDLVTAPRKTKAWPLGEPATRKRIDAVEDFLDEGGLRMMTSQEQYGGGGRVLYVQGTKEMTEEQVKALAPHLKDFDELVLEGPHGIIEIEGPTVAKLRAAIMRAASRSEMGLPELGG